MRIITTVFREVSVRQTPVGAAVECQTVKRIESEDGVWSLPISTYTRRIRTGS
ncbi:MAG: hypothetical protein ACI8TL_002093 [Natronomonas sp.]|jgi:hypothetical protein